MCAKGQMSLKRENFLWKTFWCRKQRTYWLVFDEVSCKKTGSFRRKVIRRPFSSRIVSESASRVGSGRAKRLAV